jgi:uncharacterized protein YkwD
MENVMKIAMTPLTAARTKVDTAARKIITLPRIIIGLVIVCLLFQIQKSKSIELPKYSTPKYVGESIIERVNNHRASLHLAELSNNDSLSTAARRYTEMMAKGHLQANLASVNLAGFVNNNDVKNEVKNEVDAYDNAQGMQRNTAVFESTSGSPSLDAVRTWLEQNNEVANIENPAFASTGISVVKKGDTYYVCQIFASKR